MSVSLRLLNVPSQRKRLQTQTAMQRQEIARVMEQVRKNKGGKVDLSGMMSGLDISLQASSDNSGSFSRDRRGSDPGGV